MSRDRSFRSLAVIAVLVAVVGISVAFAALSQTLNINGNVRVSGGSWRVEFANLQNPLTGGSAEIETPAALTTTTMTFDVSFNKPGDSVTYHFDVTNPGTIDAQVQSINLIGATNPDIIFTLTYADGSPITVGDTLNAGATRNLRLVVAFDINADAEAIPENDLDLNLGAQVNYIQR